MHLNGCVVARTDHMHGCCIRCISTCVDINSSGNHCFDIYTINACVGINNVSEECSRDKGIAAELHGVLDSVGINKYELHSSLVKIIGHSKTLRSQYYGCN